MAVRVRGGRWYYDFMIRKVRYRAAIPEARTKREARDVEASIRRQIYEGTYGKEQGTVSLTYYAKDVYLPWARANKKSFKADEYHVSVFESYFADKTLGEFSRILIERFKLDRLAVETRGNRSRKPASVNRELACLSRIFSMAVIDGHVSHNPCLQVKKLRENNKRDRYLTEVEEAALLAQFTGRRAYLRPIVEFALQTGARRGELLNLRRGDVNLSQRVVWFRNTKNGKDRAVPLNEKAARLVEEQFGNFPDSEYVFPSARTGKRIAELKKGFRAACDAAGLGDFHFHDLRHSFATRLAERGIDPATISNLLGHADLRMTARYAHATNRSLRAAVEAAESVGQGSEKLSQVCLKAAVNE
ncbi:MAG: tyrosine-type recombinase/integrase [Blastocatellia bacterium]